MKNLLRTAASASLALLAVGSACAYDAQSSWPSGARSFVTSLSSSSSLPGGGLDDGSASWNAVAANCVNAWKPLVTRSPLSITNTTATPSLGNGRNDISFGSTVYGEVFPDRVLAITTSQFDGSTPVPVRLTEADIVVNTKYSWNSYRGSLRGSPMDLQRVLIHELGHALGLDHPDEADPVQNVAALMNSVVSSLDGLQADDIAAARFLYDSAPARPAITSQPANVTVTTGDNATLAVSISGNPAPSSPLINYTWSFKPLGSPLEPLFTQKDASLRLGAAQPYDAGVYQLFAYTPDDTVVSNEATVSVIPVTTSTATHLGNVSTRGTAGRGDRALIVGFNISGSQPRRILIRGIGPTLTNFGLSGVVTDTTLTLKSSTDVTLASNVHWGDTDAAGMKAIFAAAGAFALPDGSLDSALVATLSPGTYTALVTPNGSAAEGLAIVEAYDIDTDTTGASRLSNLSTRGFVSTDSGVLIGGFSIKGTAPRTYLIRAVGDTLSSTFGLSGTLDDPTLELFDDTNTAIRYSDDWDSPSFLQDTLRTVFTSSGAFTFTDRQETALWLTLKPGNYTIHMKGFGGGTGLGLFEVYEATDTR